MSKIQDKLNVIMDDIQALMESHPRAHLEPDTKIYELMYSASIYLLIWMMRIEITINLFSRQ